MTENRDPSPFPVLPTAQAAHLFFGENGLDVAGIRQLVEVAKSRGWCRPPDAPPPAPEAPRTHRKLEVGTFCTMRDETALARFAARDREGRRAA
jgi:hypothetical protein